MSNASPNTALREYGCCRGNLWKQQVQGVSQSPISSEETRKTFEYCVLVGVTFISYADYNAYRRGDHPVNFLKIVGASAFNPSGGLASEVSSPQTTFRMVTNQGTHLYCTVPSPTDCSTWLASLQAGLEASYSTQVADAAAANMKPPSPPKRKGTAGNRFREKQAACTSCARPCDIITLATPLPQYGFERRCHVCPECLVSQGVWLEIHIRNQIYSSYRHEQDAFRCAREECYGVIHEHGGNGAVYDQSKPAMSHANALRDLISSPGFCSYRRLCPKLDRYCSELELGQLDPVEFIELLDETPDNEIAELKKQAFRVAGDMGSAMKLMKDYCFTGDIDMFKQILEFFLDLCDEGDLSSVAFFWPQLQGLHLKMLPPTNSDEMLRVELMEDFLLTVAIKHSIQLSLDIVWGYVADLEDSLFHTNISPSIRRRRFSVLRFVCELESILFDFQDGWGGGSVSLRNMLTPSPHQNGLLKSEMSLLSQHRRDQSTVFLSRSARLDKLLYTRFSKPPEEAAHDALRAAKHADYFSSHLSFTRRICDIAEKLRFLDLEERAPTLQKELESLNASGAMGGDPLNRLNERLMRIVRLPATEGHVFRSKERTPILLLMEVVEESDPYLREEKDIDEQLKEQAERSTRKDGPSEDEANSRRASNYAVDLQLPPDANESMNISTDVVSLPEELEADDFYVEEKFDIPFAEPGEGPKENATEGEGLPLDDIDLSDLIHQSPRALARFKRFESPLDGDHNATSVPETPSKQAMERLVTDVVIQQLNMPELNTGTTQTGEIPNSLEGENESGVQVVDEDYDGRSLKSPSQAGKHTSSRKMTALGDVNPLSTLASDDIKRNVLNAIMAHGLRGGHAIAAGAAMSAQRSLQALDRRRAVEILLNGEDLSSRSIVNRSTSKEEKETETAGLHRQKLLDLCLSDAAKEVLETNVEDSQSEEDEAMEALRLLLIQNKKSKERATGSGNQSSLRNLNAPVGSDGIFDKSEIIEIDAGDVDARLTGCGVLPPAVLSALTLWKGGIVTTVELLELVKKDLQFIQQAENPGGEADEENSAFWGRFAFGERWAEKKARIAATSPEGSVVGWDLQGVIVKSNDDLRQEAFVMQLIELCREAFDMAGLELWVHPYRILATGRTTGIIECVKNAMSFDALKKRPGYKDGLRGHLKRMSEFSSNPGEAFTSMQHNFVRSLASYSLMSYIFLFKDRHNGNILLDTAGHVIHIDFGFVFGVAPGGSFSLEMSTPFKLTEEMLEVMGGMQSPFFSEFVTLFCCGFLALRAHMDTFLTLVEITCNNSSFKCFDGRDSSEVVEKMRSRFCPELSKESAIAFALDLIKQATQSYGTKQYDFFQYLSQGIAA